MFCKAPASIAGIVTSIVFSIICPSAFADPVKTDLFLYNTDGYRTCRIPGIVVTSKGTILAYCEARHGDGTDWSAIDDLLRRSTDGGKTWEPLVVLASHGKSTENNPVMIPDTATGAVHFLHCMDYARCFYSRSDDEGKTFSEAVEITETFEAFRKDFPWKVLATGPGHGIQLKTGRLVVPVWLAADHSHRPSVTASIYSDDHGKTWRAGDILPGHDTIKNMNETAAVELNDGRVMFNIRSESMKNLRVVAVSPDCATGWSMPTFDNDLYEPICFGSILGVHDAGGFHVLFSNPDSRDHPAKPGKMGPRRNLTIRLSDDAGKTWSAAKVLEAGVAGYSDLAAGPDGTIYCFYERGGVKDMFDTGALTVARFRLAWVTARE